MRLDVNRPGFVIVFAAATALVFTAGIMALHAGTSGIVEANRQAFDQRARVNVLAGALEGVEAFAELSDAEVSETYRRHIRALPAVRDPQTGNEYVVYAAYDRVEDGKPTGPARAYAFPVWGLGFWARIEGYVAVTPDLTKIVGVVFTAHQETPGLGGRITEPQWQQSFDGLKITPPPAGGQILYVGKEPPANASSPKAGRFVDAITGATGTSNAVEAFLNQRIDEFRRAAETQGIGG